MSGFTSVTAADGTLVVGFDSRESGHPDRSEAQILVQRPDWTHLRWRGTARWLSTELRWQLWDRDGQYRRGAGDLFTILEAVAADPVHF